MKLYFLSFGGPTKDYHDAVERICKQAEMFELFDKIIGLTEQDLQNDDEFWGKHKDFINSNQRGYGYWLWKPYIIKKKMEQLEVGDILLYLDCGCEIDIRNREIIKDYFEKVKQYYIIGAPTGNKERKYNKMDVPIFLDMVDDRYLNSGQEQAGAILFFVCEKMIRFVNEW